MFRQTTCRSAVIWGVHLHRRLNWTGYCEAMRIKDLRTLTQLVPMLTSSLPQWSKSFLSKPHFRPQMTIASPAWALIVETQISCLQVVQNRDLGLIGGYDRHALRTNMHLDHQILMLKNYIKTLAQKMQAFAKTNGSLILPLQFFTQGFLDPSYPKLIRRRGLARPRNPKFQSFKKKFLRLIQERSKFSPT